MLKRAVPLLALFFILFVLSKNMVFFPGYLRAMVTGHPPVVSETPPGRNFMALAPYLKDIPLAGYYTDRYDQDFWNSDIASRIYQQAQYALAPTLLDVTNCFSYPYVIFECAQANCALTHLKEHNLEILLKINDNIALTRRASSRKMP